MDKTNYTDLLVSSQLCQMYWRRYRAATYAILDKVASPHLSGFRQDHSCQDVLLNFAEKFKEDIGLRKAYSSVITQLFKAFDCLPPRLTVCKLHAYGLSECACKRLANYFMNPFQGVKVVGDMGD